MDEKEADLLDRFAQFALIAAREAMADSGLSVTPELAARMAIITGTIMAMIRRSMEARRGALVTTPESAGTPADEEEPIPLPAPNGKSKKPTVTGVPIKRAGAEATGGQ